MFKIEDTVVSQPNEVWASDLTYLPMEKGFAYLVAVMDLFDRSILGWEVSDTMKAENTDMALLRALRAASGSLPYLAVPFRSRKPIQCRLCARKVTPLMV